MMSALFARLCAENEKKRERRAEERERARERDKGAKCLTLMAPIRAIFLSLSLHSQVGAARQLALGERF